MKRPGQTLEALDWLRRSFCSKILEYFLRSFLIIWKKQRKRCCKSKFCYYSQAVWSMMVPSTTLSGANTLNSIPACSEQRRTAWWKPPWQGNCYLDLVGAEQGGGSGSPEQLTEAVLVVLLKQTALERPQPVCIVHLHKHRSHEMFNKKNSECKLILPIIVVVWRAVVHLVAPPGDGGDDVTTGWVPLHIRGHVVLGYVHHSAVWRVDEGKCSIHAAQNRELCMCKKKYTNQRWWAQCLTVGLRATVT